MIAIAWLWGSYYVMSQKYVISGSTRQYHSYFRRSGWLKKNLNGQQLAHMPQTRSFWTKLTQSRNGTCNGSSRGRHT